MRTPIPIALILFSLFVIRIQARTDRRPCTTSCGDINNIGYPFRLRGDPAHCGDLDYELYCDPNNRTILNFHAGLYYVRRISYADRVIRLVDVNLATGNCGLPYRSLGIEEVLGDSRYNRRYSSPHASFVRCSEEINSMRNNIVPCLSGNTSRVYLNFTDFMLYPLDIPSSCSVIAMALSGGSDDPNVNVPTSYDDIRMTLQLGFDLIWTVECRDCVADGGYCQFPTERNRFRCSKEEDYATQLRNAILYLAAVCVIGMTILCRYILAPLAVFIFILHKCCSKRNRIEQ